MERFLEVLPSVAVSARFFVEGEEGSIKDADVITCRVGEKYRAGGGRGTPGGSKSLGVLNKSRRQRASGKEVYRKLLCVCTCG